MAKPWGGLTIHGAIFSGLDKSYLKLISPPLELLVSRMAGLP